MRNNKQHNNTLLWRLSCAILFLFCSQLVSAACSSYAGLATINEVYRENSNDRSSANDFLEIKLIDGSIASSVFNSWSIVARRWDEGPTGTSFSLSTFDSSNLPWLALKSKALGDHLNSTAQGKPLIT